MVTLFKEKKSAVFSVQVKSKFNLLTSKEDLFLLGCQPFELTLGSES